VDILQLVEVLWKRKWIIAVGAVLGLLLTFRALYTMDISLSYPRSFELKPRSFTIYQTSVNLMLDEPSFGMGSLQKEEGKEGTSFGRLASLATTYSYLITSDAVATRVQKKIGSADGSLEAEPVEDSTVIKVTAEGANSEAVQKLTRTTADVFIAYIRAQQKANNIPPGDRVLVRKLGPPAEPIQIRSRKIEIAFLMFMFPLAASSALAFVLENLDKSKAYRRKSRLIIEPPKSSQKNA